MGKAARKVRGTTPEMEQEDVCWFCENPEDCRNCQIGKLFTADQKKKKDREFNHNMHRLHEYDNY